MGEQNSVVKNSVGKRTVGDGSLRVEFDLRCEQEALATAEGADELIDFEREEGCANRGEKYEHDEWKE